jgi:hypothetical protein
MEHPVTALQIVTEVGSVKLISSYICALESKTYVLFKPRSKNPRWIVTVKLRYARMATEPSCWSRDGRQRLVVPDARDWFRHIAAVQGLGACAGEWARKSLSAVAAAGTPSTKENRRQSPADGGPMLERLGNLLLPLGGPHGLAP